MARVQHVVDYCDRCGRDVSTETRGAPMESGLIHLSWHGRVNFVDGYGGILASGEKSDAIDMCHHCFLETERFLLNKHHPKED